MNQWTLALRWALIYVAVALLWMAFERVVGLHDQYIMQHMYWTNVFFVLIILVYVLAMRDAKEKVFGGQMSWLEGFYFGMIVTGVITVLAPLTQYIISTYITPHYFDNVIAASLEAGYIKTREEAMAYFNLENYIIQNTLGSLMIGGLLSAIIALFVKTRPKTSFYEQP